MIVRAALAQHCDDAGKASKRHSDFGDYKEEVCVLHVLPNGSGFSCNRQR